MLAAGKIVDVEKPGVQPVLIGVVGGELVLDLLVVDDAPLRGVDEEHAAGLQAALA